MVIELVGPAGAGKSTLAQALCRRHAALRGPMSLWGQPRKALLASALRLVPYWLSAARHGYAPPLEAFTHMMRLDAMLDSVDRAATESPVLLDEGPIFGLGWLEVFFPANGDRVARAWRERMLREWANRIDLVVMLDASNPVLAERIQTREKPHDVKHRAPPEIYAFTERYRRALTGLVESLDAVGVSICRLATDDHHHESAAALVGEHLESAPYGE